MARHVNYIPLFDNGIQIVEESTPIVAPPSGYIALYAKADGGLYLQNPLGQEYELVMASVGTTLYDLRVLLEKMLLELRLHNENLATLTAAAGAKPQAEPSDTKGL